MDILSKNDNELLSLSRNATAALHKPDKSARAQEILDKIDREWNRRLFRRGKYRATTPKEGVMSTMGYHVGELEGISRNLRLEILNWVLHRNVPCVQSPAHMEEWTARNQGAL